MYDVGQGKDDSAPLPGNRKKKETVSLSILHNHVITHMLQVETHDPKTGELVRINADDDTITLGEMLRQERMNAGAADQKDLDAQLARAITTDGGFVVCLLRVFSDSQKISYVSLGQP